MDGPITNNNCEYVFFLSFSYRQAPVLLSDPLPFFFFFSFSPLSGYPLVTIKIKIKNPCIFTATMKAYMYIQIQSKLIRFTGGGLEKLAFSGPEGSRMICSKLTSTWWTTACKE